MCLNVLFRLYVSTAVLDMLPILRDAKGLKLTVKSVYSSCWLLFIPRLGREIAEVTSMYSSGEYDLAGFVVGAVERGQMLLGLQRADEEDVFIGLASSGIHGRAFTIIRKILLVSSLHYSSPAPGSCGDKTLGKVFSFSEASLQMDRV